MKKKNSMLPLAIFLVLSLFALTGYAWEDYASPYCININFSASVNGTIFLELSNNTEYSYFNSSGYDVRFYNGTCADSGQAQLNFFRESWQTYGNYSHFFVNLTSNSTNKIALFFGNMSYADASNYTYVFYNNADVTMATTTGWTAIGTGVSVNTTARKVNVASTNSNANGVYCSIRGTNAPTNFILLHRFLLTATSQGGGSGVTDSNTGAFYNNPPANSVASEVYNEANFFYLDGRAGGTNYQTGNVYNPNGIEHYGKIVKNGNTFTANLYLTRNMTTLAASITKTQAGWVSAQYIFPFNTYATGFGNNAVTGWVNQTYLIDYNADFLANQSEITSLTETFVTIYSPAETTYYNKTINVTFAVTGANASYFCNYTIGSEINVSNELLLNNTNYNTQYHNLSEGNKTLSIICANQTTSDTASRNFNIDLYDFNTTYFNYTEYNGTKYAHTLKANITGYCADNYTNAIVNITTNTTLNYTFNLTCDNSTHNYIYNITAASEGNITVNSTLFKGNLTQDTTIGIEYRSDIYSPNATFSYNLSAGFNITTKNINISVNDTISPYVLCNISINSVAYSNVNFSNNQSNYTFNISDGYNNFTATCWDIVNNSVSISNSTYFYLKKIVLIYEDDGTNLSANNLTNMTIRAISENYDTIFSFNAYNITYMWILSNESDTYRIEKVYNAYPNELFFIDLNLGMISESEIPVCVSSLQTLYEILFYSSTEKPVVVLNTLADCYVLAEYTEYAYQDAYMAKAYTIKAKYQLYTYDDGLRVLLAAVDGSLATTIALDVLEFSKTSYNLGALTEEVSINGMGNSTVKIYYQNQNNNSDSTSISIYNGSTLIWSYTETLQPNNITLYFDYSTLGLTSNDLMRLVLVRTTDGVQTTITKIFNLQGSTGLLTSPLAIFLGLIILFFGLTISASNRTFGFFGVGFTLIALAITTLAVPDAPLRLFQAILIITLIFIGFIWKEENITIT